MPRAQHSLPSICLAEAGVGSPVLLPYPALLDVCNYRSRLPPSNQTRPMDPRPLRQILCYAQGTKAWMVADKLVIEMENCSYRESPAVIEASLERQKRVLQS